LGDDGIYSIIFLNTFNLFYFILVLCPDLIAERPREHESLNNIIIVDNLPKVDQTKLEKLKAAVSKVYSKFGICRSEYYPLDTEGKTKGYKKENEFY
jgi:hypothetical protein